MPFAISPKHTTDFGIDGWTIDKKIDVFIARIQGWQLDIANQIIEHKIQDRGFAILHIITSYFEMIAKYGEGYIGKNKSKKHFIKGVKMVFPKLLELSEEYSKEIMNLLYKNVRSGMYHMGMIGERVILTGDIKTPLGYDAGNQIITINPNLIVRTVNRHFSYFSSELRNPTNIELRENFEKRFNFDTGLIS